jgi:TolA-binding protein
MNLSSALIPNLVAMDLLKKNKTERRSNQMNTKSRYEVIAELEDKKRSLIIQKDGLNDKLTEMKRSLRDMKRDVEDQEEEIKLFEENKKRQEETFDELIKSTEESLKRFGELEKKK